MTNEARKHIDDARKYLKKYPEDLREELLVSMLALSSNAVDLMNNINDKANLLTDRSCIYLMFINDVLVPALSKQEEESDD